MDEMKIRRFKEKYLRDLVALWEKVFGYDAPHNDPALVISKKSEVDDGLLFVAENESGRMIGSVMCGYDGHRGWIYSLAVSPDDRRKGIGKQLMVHAEKALKARGCVKINLQIMEGNDEVESFYRNLGYITEPRISMGKRIPENIG